MRKLICLFTFFVYSLSCHAIELASDDALVLEKFFRVMIEKSDCGYVLNNNKPLCVLDYHKIDYFEKEHENHAHAVALREGAKKWNQLNFNHLNSNILIHVYSDEACIENCIPVLFINKKLFHEAVNKNLSLFQSILGPDTTSMDLLKKLTEPNISFQSILHDNKLLLGILLGFDTQNSLYLSRIENLHEYFLAPEHVPFKNLLVNAEKTPIEILEQLLMHEGKAHQKISNTNPSFGYSSLEDELVGLHKKMGASKIKLKKNSPSLVFIHLKDNKESDEILNSETITKLQINILLNSNHFLKDVLSILYPEEEIVVHPSHQKLLSFNSQECAKFTDLTAENIWHVMKNHNALYQMSFINGMMDANNGESQKIDHSILGNYDKLKALEKIKKNLEQSDIFFSQLHENTNHVCVMPYKLYYKIREQGFGKNLDDQVQVKVKYIIRTPHDQVILSDNWNNNQASWIDLRQVIQGFAWGMKGMKVGEVREIYIHPSVGYGIYTTFDKGTYLTALVKLWDIGNSLDAVKLEDLHPFEFNEIDENFDQKYAEEEKKTGYSRGYQVWKHYSKGKFCNLAEIIHRIDLLQKNEHPSNISSKNSQDLINRLHWNIYQSQ